MKRATDKLRADKLRAEQRARAAAAVLSASGRCECGVHPRPVVEQRPGYITRVACIGCRGEVLLPFEEWLWHVGRA